MRGCARFQLSASQIRTDSPNHFTGVFLGGNGGSTVLYSDRRPTYFHLIVEWLSGYDDFFDHLKPRDGVSEREALAALVIEAEHFKLKGLAERVGRELAKCALRADKLALAEQAVRQRPPTRVSYLEDSRDTVQEGDTSTSQLGFTLTSIQVRFDCRLLDDDDDDNYKLPSVRLEFVNEKGQRATAPHKPIKVDLCGKSSRQGSATVDGSPISLAVLLRWIVNPTRATSKIPALRPLVDYFHPELTPRDKRVVTIRAHKVVGDWSHGNLWLAHLSIRSQDQGYLTFA
ncbi:hypothetical protein JCM3775_000234 [Rhodotorula graminis]